MSAYNIIINSVNKIGGDNSSNYQYTFDWGQLPYGEYDLLFCFNSDVSVDTDFGIVSIPDLGVARHTFSTESNRTSSQFNGVIGIIKPEVTALSTYIYSANTVSNPPVYLPSRPMQNQFTVYIRDVAGDLLNIDGDYVLILSFRRRGAQPPL